MIPRRLHQGGFRFCKIKSKSKIPFELGWQLNKNYSYDNADLVSHIRKGGNFGIVTGLGSLLVVDCDHKIAEELVEENLPPTFVVQTGSGKKHFYFICKDGRNLKLFLNENKDSLADIQFTGRQVVCPNSVHPSGQSYKVLEDPPIAEIEFVQLIYCFKDYLKYSHKEKIKKSEEDLEEKDPICKEIKEKVKLQDLMKKYGYDLTKNPTMCLLGHSSINERCFSYDSDLWHCFHCDQGGNIFHFVMAHDKCDFVTARRYLVKYLKKDDEEKSTSQDKIKFKGKRNKADAVVDLAIKACNDFFHDQFSIPYAAIIVDDHQEIYPIRSKNFRRWLANLYWEENNESVSNQTILTALNIIEAKAVFNGKLYCLSNRVAWHDDAIYYDLTDDKWRVVKINDQGWEILEKDYPILFRRYSHQLPQVLPNPNESVTLDSFLEFTNISNAGDKLLILSFIVTSLIPDIPHPILIQHGPQGSAKSFCFKLIRSLIDPSSVELLTNPKDKKEIIQNLAHHYLAFFDNISSIPAWLSDIFCRAVTGEGFSKRELYTDDEDIIYSFKRNVGLNGINVAATRPDLLDRSILIELYRIPKEKRKTEKKLREDFGKIKSHVLAALFSTLSETLRIKKEIEKDLKELPRMADFALYAEAATRALDYKNNEFLKIYEKNIGLQHIEAVEGYVIGPAILDLMDRKGVWEGSATELLAELYDIAEQIKIDTRVRTWPKAAHSLTRRLKELKTNLEEMDIELSIDRDPKSNKSFIKLQSKQKAPKAPKAPKGKKAKSEDNDSFGAHGGIGDNSLTPYRHAKEEKVE